MLFIKEGGYTQPENPSNPTPPSRRENGEYIRGKQQLDELERTKAELVEAQSVARELALRWVSEHGYDNHRHPEDGGEHDPLLDKAIAYPAKKE